MAEENKKTIDDFCKECNSKQKLTLVSSNPGAMLESTIFNMYKCPNGHITVKSEGDEIAESYEFKPQPAYSVK